MSFVTKFVVSINELCLSLHLIDFGVIFSALITFASLLQGCTPEHIYHRICDINFSYFSGQIASDF
jgi:hypothetical protein